MNRFYEAMIILDQEKAEANKPEVLEKVSSLITAQEAVISAQKELGRKRLAYEIDKKREGFYWLVRFEAKPASLKKMKRALVLSDLVLKYLIVNQDSQASWELDERDQKTA